MKKLITALLALAFIVSMGVCVMAGTFDGYWDFPQDDGTYAYGFPRIKVSLDETWYKNTRVVLGESGSTVSFYHKGSYNAYAEEGLVGGLLFTTGASVNTDFKELPHFVYLGFDEEEAMNYYASLPTDYQAYTGDEAVRKEYDELWRGVEDVLANVVIKGSDKFRELYGTDDDQTGASSSGENNAVSKSAQSDAEESGHFDEEEKALEIKGSPAAQDGVTVTLKSAAAQRKSDPDGYEYSFTGTIENNSDESIMQVIYTFALMDGDEEEFRSFSEVYDREDTASPPHTSVDFSHTGIKWGPQSVPAAVELGISSVKTEAELPPVHVPAAGEYLYQALEDENLANIKEKPPVELSFHVDQGGYGRTAVFKEGETLDKAIELFCAIRIGEESDEWVTDNYNGIRLKWADGTSTGISLNLSSLEYWIHSNIHTYELENLGEFWSYCADYLEEDVPYQEDGE